jgi:heavy metal sensor kinase
MKSIRLSLIVYFLVLIALALGGVSTFAYQTATKTLRDKQTSTEHLICTQYKTRCQDARAALDRRLQRQALYLASHARTVPIPKETFFVVSGTASMSSPHSMALAPLMFAPATMSVPTADALPNYMTLRLSFMVRPVRELQIPDTAESDLVLDLDHPAEYFQTFHCLGRPPYFVLPAQRSASLRDHWLTLGDEVRDLAEDYQPVFDDLELDGQPLRRVTLRARVTRTRIMVSPFSRFFPTPGKTKGQGPKGPPRPSYDQNAPAFFIQYASDTAHLAEQIQDFQEQRDTRLAQSHEETQAAFAHLRQRLFWISCLTFAGIIVGALLLLRLGLAPLSRLSDAVSKVSEKNFELQVEPHKLPTELRPIAERLSQSLSQLQRAFNHEKQAAADISHELRTPLAALLTTLDVALRKKRTLEEYRDVLEECRTSGKHMSHLVERLMALARLDAGVERPSLEVVDIAELAQQSADMVRPLAEEQGLTLRANLEEPVCTMTDACKLRDVLVNLLHNAIEYNKPAGRIDIDARRDNGHVVVAVRDTGIGIAPEAQEHLFERFFRADPSRHADTPHCGLGLAIVKSYVDLLGGAIRVQSSPAGSTFEVRLPLRGSEITTFDQQTVVQAAGR